MRTGEVFALTWNDIDLEKRIIKITKTVYAKDRSKKARWYIGSTKTESSYREFIFAIHYIRYYIIIKMNRRRTEKNMVVIIKIIQ